MRGRTPYVMVGAGDLKEARDEPVMTRYLVPGVCMTGDTERVQLDQPTGDWLFCNGVITYQDVGNTVYATSWEMSDLTGARFAQTLKIGEEHEVDRPHWT